MSEGPQKLVEDGLKSVTDQVEKLNFVPRVGKALGKAWDKAKEAKGLMKIWVFGETFLNEIKEVKDAKDKATEDANNGIQQDINTTMGKVKESSGLQDSVTGEDKELYEKVEGMVAASFSDLDATHQGAAKSAFDQMDKAVKDKPFDALNLDQSTSLGAVALSVISKLKEKFPKKEDFQKALDKLDSITDNTNYPIKKLLSTEVLKVFKVKMDLGVNLESLGKAAEAADFLGKFGVGLTDAMGVKDTLADLKEQPMKDEDGVVDTLKEYFLPNTDRSKIKVVVKTLNTMIATKATKLDTKILTTLVFNVENADLNHLITILSGKESPVV